MIVYDKEQKEIVIPNGIGNINLYNNGVEAGYNQGYEQGQADSGAKARVLNVTENGNYVSKFSDPIIPAVTGVYADGTEFYNYAYLEGISYDSGFIVSEDMEVEIWWKGDVSRTDKNLLGSHIMDKNAIFKIRISDTAYCFDSEIAMRQVTYRNAESNRWYHLKMSYADGFWVDGVKIGDFSSNISGVPFNLYINSNTPYLFNGVNGYFGMIKITTNGVENIIIPTAEGLKNVTTDEMLQVELNGSYTFTENKIIYGEGELYKTINVNVPDLNGSYNEGKIDGINEQISKLETITITKNGTYNRYDGFNKIIVKVPDLNGSYDEGYAQGKTDGINEQKSKLESISITENGTYNKEDGYNHIEVNVPDLNGSYDEGYHQGQADVAENARVLNVTENGNYMSKFSDPIIPANVTGVYADGTKFYSYAELTNIVYNTGIKVSENTKIEIWYKPRDLGFISYGGIIGPIEDTSDNAFNIHTYIGDGFNNSPIGDVFNGRIKFYNSYYKPNDLNKWFHLELSFADGFIIDGVVIGTYTTNTSNYGRDIYINKYERSADGYYGMIKIDDTIIIPTEEGFLNTSTSELLEVVENGSYVYTNNEIIQGEGEMYKTINVDVKPKINVKEAGLRLGYSTFTEVPEWADFEGITDMSNMFNSCSRLQTIPLIDTSNVRSMYYMFANCSNLQTIPLIDTSNVRSMERMFYECSKLQTIPLLKTSNATNMYYMFYNCKNLQTIPPLNTSNVTNMDGMFTNCFKLQAIPSFDTSKVTNMNNMFGNCNSLVSLPALDAQSLKMPSYGGIFDYNALPKITDFGGFLNLKCSLTNDKNLKKLPNLTKESCLNILNGLYDFTGNGETPNSEQGQLKVHPNFLATVGDKISIGVAKGWSITA